MKLESIAIPGADAILSALRYVPDRAVKPTALIFSHGFTSGKYSMDSLANYLAARGYGGWTYDFVGHKLGCSGGEMRTARQAAENLRDVLKFVRESSEAERIVLIGHSMGGAATLQVAAWEQTRGGDNGAPLVGITCLCMGLEPTRGFDGPIGQAMLAQRQDYVQGAPALQLLTELNTMILSAKEIGSLPALFIAARQDVLVSIERVEALAALAGPTASIQVVDTTHLEAPDRSRAAIIQWLDTQFT